VKFLDKNRGLEAVEGVKAHGLLMLGTNLCRPGTKYKRSKIAFAVTFYTFTVVHMRKELQMINARFLTRSPGTLVPPPLG